MTLLLSALVNPSTQEAQAGRLKVWGQPQLHDESLSQNNNNNNNNNNNTLTNFKVSQTHV
jgi:hypothetical protein